MNTSHFRIKHAKLRAASIFMPDFIQPLFHNYEVSSVDLYRDWRLVIKTVMQGGNWEQIQWVANFYGREKFEQVLREDLDGNQTLARPVANFWSVLLWNKLLPTLQKGQRWRQTRKIPEVK